MTTRQVYKRAMDTLKQEKDKKRTYKQLGKGSNGRLQLHTMKDELRRTNKAYMDNMDNTGDNNPDSIWETLIQKPYDGIIDFEPGEHHVGQSFDFGILL